MVQYRVEFAKGHRRAPFAAGQAEETARHMARHQCRQFLNAFPGHGPPHEPVTIREQIFPSPSARRRAEGPHGAIAGQTPEQVAPQLGQRGSPLDGQQ